MVEPQQPPAALQLENEGKDALDLVRGRQNRPNQAASAGIRRDRVHNQFVAQDNLVPGNVLKKYSYAG